MSKSNGITVLLLKEVTQAGPVWTASWLECDVVGQGDTMQEAYTSLLGTIYGACVMAHQRGELPFKDKGSAPQLYWNLYNSEEAEVVDLEEPDFTLDEHTKELLQSLQKDFPQVMEPKTKKASVPVN